MKISNVALHAMPSRFQGTRNGSCGLLQQTCCDGRINEQFLGMLNRTSSDLLGSIEDHGAYPPPKAVHRANAEATIRCLCASIHDNWSPGLDAPASVRPSQAIRTSPFLPVFGAVLASICSEYLFR